jgi:hypothetical protein
LVILCERTVLFPDQCYVGHVSRPNLIRENDSTKNVDQERRSVV